VLQSVFFCYIFDDDKQLSVHQCLSLCMLVRRTLLRVWTSILYCQIVFSIRP
jgi:hypothetical protein